MLPTSLLTSCVMAQSLNPDPKLLEELYILPAVEEKPAGNETLNGDSHPGMPDLQHISISA